MGNTIRFSRPDAANVLNARNSIPAAPETKPSGSPQSVTPTSTNPAETLLLQTENAAQPRALSIDFVATPALPTAVNFPDDATLSTPAPSSPTLGSIRNGQDVLAPGDSSGDVQKLQEMLGKIGYKVQHSGDKLEGEILRALQNFQADYGVASKTSQYSGHLGKNTLNALESALKGPQINTKHPLLSKLNTLKITSYGKSTCVESVFMSLDKKGVKTFSGGTTGDPNNPRGAMVQMQKAGHWRSAPLPGSKPKTINSPYGSVKADVLSAGAYEKLVNQGKIPNGSVVFQTSHGWEYSGGSRGNDVGIVQNGRIYNYADMGSMYVYPNLKEVVVMVPRDAIKP